MCCIHSILWQVKFFFLQWLAHLLIFVRSYAWSLHILLSLPPHGEMHFITFHTWQENQIVSYQDANGCQWMLRSTAWIVWVQSEAQTIQDFCHVLNGSNKLSIEKDRGMWLKLIICTMAEKNLHHILNVNAPMQLILSTNCYRQLHRVYPPWANLQKTAQEY